MPFTSRAGRALFSSACLLLAGTYLLALFTPAAGTYHDDGIYLVTARALAEGKGYRIISMPGEPFQTKYPVLYPWLVSMLWRMWPTFPANLPWLRLVGVASLIAWLSASWHLWRRLGLTPQAAWVAALLLAASPSVLFMSTSFMSEVTFGAFSIAGLLVLSRIHDGQGRRYDGLLTGLLMGAALLTRAAGVPMALGSCLGLAIAKRWRDTAYCAGGALVCALPWSWWVARQNAALASIDPYYSASPYAAWNIVFNYTLAEKQHVLLMNVTYGGMAPALFWDIRMPPWWAILAALMFALVIVRGLWKERRHPVALVMAIYLAMVMCWVWPPLRFLTPVAPGVAWLVVAGAPHARYVVRVLAIVIALASSFQLWQQILERLEKGTTWPISGTAESWPSLSPLLEWVARETPSDAIVTGNLDPMYFLYTGRKAIRAFTVDAYSLYYDPATNTQPLGTVDDFRRRLLSMQASYLIMTPGAGFGEMPYLRALVSELMAARPLALSVATGSGSSGYVVYQIHPAQLAEPIAGAQQAASNPKGTSARR